MKRIVRHLLDKWIRTALIVLCVTVVAGTGFPTSGHCEDKATNESIEALIKLLQKKGVITQNEANRFTQRLNDTGGEPQDEVSASEAERLKKELKDTQEKLDRSVDQLLQRDRLTERKLEELDTKVKDDVAVKQYKSSWAQRVKFNGDVRLRYQSELFDENNAAVEDPDDRSKFLNTTVDRNRFRYRVRLGMKAKVIDPRDVNAGKVDIGLRLATGSSGDPVSTNTTLGDYFNKDAILLDRAYLKWAWQPIEAEGGRKPEWSFISGRMPNPFVSTDLVWDSDLNFEGASIKRISDVLEGGSFRWFFTAGAFPLQELELRSSDKWLYGGQIGLEHRPFWGLNYSLAVAYYHYENIQGVPLNDETEMTTIEDWNWSVPQYRQKGNSLVIINPFPGVADSDLESGLASQFQELNVTAKIDIDRFYPIHCILWADYVQNLGYDKDEMEALSAVSVVPQVALEEQTTGYQVGITVGYPKVREWGEWNFSVAYRYLEADAVVDAFTDSDFHGGGTDAEGYILGFQLGLYKNVWLSTKYMSANEIYEDPANPDATHLAIDVFQVNLNGKF